MVDIFEQNRTAIVRVVGAKEKSRGSTPTLFVSTGFLVSSEGHVITSSNSVHDVDEIWIEHMHQSYPAAIVGRDSVSNVAVLKLKQLPQTFSYITIADDTRRLPVSTLLFSISCEMGLDPGPSWGLLTGYNLYYSDRVLPTTHIRTDIPSGGGEGGAPVFDLNGNFIGMMAVSLPDIQSSFVLPASALRRVRDDIMFGGAVQYGYLGMRINERAIFVLGSPLEVDYVVEGSPAQKAGVKRGDKVIRVGGRAIQELMDLHDATFFARPGHYLPIDLEREGKRLHVSLKVAPQPPREALSEPSKDDVAFSVEMGHPPRVPDHRPRAEAVH